MTPQGEEEGRERGEGRGQGGPLPTPPYQKNRRRKVSPPPPRGTKTDLDKCRLEGIRQDAEKGGERAGQPDPARGRANRPDPRREGKGKSPLGPPQGSKDPGPGVGRPQ